MNRKRRKHRARERDRKDRRLKEKAVNALGLREFVWGRRQRWQLKGGTFKMSVAIKGFEIDDLNQIKTIMVESEGSGYTSPPAITVEDLDE